MPGKNDRTIEDFKNILREAIEVKDQLSVAAKEKVLAFKNTLNDYVEALDEYESNQANPGDSDEVYEVEKSDNKLEMLSNDLKDQSEELLNEIAFAKKTSQ